MDQIQQQQQQLPSQQPEGHKQIGGQQSLKPELDSNKLKLAPIPTHTTTTQHSKKLLQLDDDNNVKQDNRTHNSDFDSKTVNHVASSKYTKPQQQNNNKFHINNQTLGGINHKGQLNENVKKQQKNNIVLNKYKLVRKINFSESKKDVATSGSKQISDNKNHTNPITGQESLTTNRKLPTGDKWKSKTTNHSNLNEVTKPATVVRQVKRNYMNIVKGTNYYSKINTNTGKERTVGQQQYDAAPSVYQTAAAAAQLPSISNKSNTSVHQCPSVCKNSIGFSGRRVRMVTSEKK